MWVVSVCMSHYFVKKAFVDVDDDEVFVDLKLKNT